MLIGCDVGCGTGVVGDDVEIGIECVGSRVDFDKHISFGGKNHDGNGHGDCGRAEKIST